MSTANETQVGGSHYKTGYQHWDLVWNTNMGYFPAQITKYLSRHTKKNGLQDVQKAIHFAAKYAELLDAADDVRGVWNGPNTDKYLQMYRISNPHLTSAELSVIKGCVTYHSHKEVEGFIKVMQEIAGQYPTPGYVKQGD
jgi:hypothetical protein